MINLLNPFNWFREPCWEEQVEINRQRAEAEASERERKKRLNPDLLAKLENYFQDKVCSNGKPLEFKLGYAPLGEDCVVVQGPHNYGWIVPAELHKSWKSGYYILSGNGFGEGRVSEAKLMGQVSRIFAG